MKFLKILPALIVCLSFSSCASMGNKDGCCAKKAKSCCAVAKKEGKACTSPGCKKP